MNELKPGTNVRVKIGPPFYVRSNLGTILRKDKKLGHQGIYQVQLDVPIFEYKEKTFPKVVESLLVQREDLEVAES